jgi:hypothetical protein
MFRSLAVRALVLASLAIGAFAPAAAARSAVDPATLVPPVQPDAACFELGGGSVQCEIYVLLEWQNEPSFELPCGLVYETRSDERFVTRWFEDGLLVRRLVHQRAEGSWSLSPTGEAPLVMFSSDTNWGEVYTVPGDVDSAVGHQRGTDYLIKAANGGVIGHISGRTHGSDEQFEGRMVFDEAALCEALGG